MGNNGARRFRARQLAAALVPRACPRLEPRMHGVSILCKQQVGLKRKRQQAAALQGLRRTTSSVKPDPIRLTLWNRGGPSR